MSQAYDGTYECFQYNQAITTATTRTLRAAVTGKKYYVTKAIFSSDTAERFSIASNSTVVLGPIEVLPGTSFDCGELLLPLALGEALNVINSDGSVGALAYVEGHIRTN